MPRTKSCPTACAACCAVVYLIFNEGYVGGAGEELVRGELCAEAIRLGRLLYELLPAEAEAWGLLALMLLHDARTRRPLLTPTAGYVAPLPTRIARCGTAR